MRVLITTLLFLLLGYMLYQGQVQAPSTSLGAGFLVCLFGLVLCLVGTRGVSGTDSTLERRD